MATHHQYIQLSSLPDEVRRKVEEFIAALMREWESAKKEPSHGPKDPARPRIFGIAKGMATISPDFDAPLEDMKDYME